MVPLVDGQAVAYAKYLLDIGLDPAEAVAAVKDVLDSIGDTCPECPPEDIRIGHVSGSR